MLYGMLVPTKQLAKIDNAVPSVLPIQTAKKLASKLAKADMPKITTDGWTKEVTVVGDGISFPKKGNTVTLDYTGTLLNGKVFDDSRAAGRTPIVIGIGVGQLIRGWEEAVLTMSIGERCKLTIQPEWAYGKRGAPPDIAPNAVLVFDMKLLKVKA